jgi:hypothetical protein
MLLSCEPSGRQCCKKTIVPKEASRILRSADNFRGTYVFITNQIAIATMITMIAPQTAGVTFFELPLRGESFGAWL